MYNKILLIHPPLKNRKSVLKFITVPPVGLMYLAGAIPEHEVKIIDLRVEKEYYDINKLKEEIQRYDLVGVTSLTANILAALNLCKIAHSYNIPTIMGGFHVSLEPDIIDKYPFIDMVLIGEGEFAFKEIVEGVPKKDILGLSYRENGVVYHNSARPLVKDLNSFPYIRQDVVDPSNYGAGSLNMWAIDTTRGCPFSCKFCCVTKFYGQSYRAKSKQRVIKELFMVPKDTKVVFITDDNLTMKEDRVIELCNLIRKYKLHKRLMFFTQCRVDDMANKPEMVKAMGKAGFAYVQLGIESFSQKALDLMNKKYDADKIYRAVKNCHKNGIFVIGGIIVGNVGETWEDAIHTAEMMKRVNLDIFVHITLVPYPGTELNAEAKEKGWMKKDFDWTQWNHREGAINTPELTSDQVTELDKEVDQVFYGDVKNVIRILTRYIAGVFRPKYKSCRRANVFSMFKDFLEARKGWRLND